MESQASLIIGSWFLRRSLTTDALRPCSTGAEPPAAGRRLSCLLARPYWQQTAMASISISRSSNAKPDTRMAVTQGPGVG